MKKLSLIFLAAITALTLLVSCGGEQPDNKPQTGNLIYESGTQMRVITLSSDIAYDHNAVISAVKTATGLMPQSFYDMSVVGEHEIVIGATSRDVSVYAKQYVESLNMTSNDVTVWCIYAYQGSVAVYWTHDIPDAANIAINYLIENYLDGSSLYLEDGPVYYATYDRRAYEDAREAALRQQQLDDIEAILGVEARNAIADYLRMYTDDYYIWLANLYDPGTGGFYYSNSGRDNDGFLPDVESTMQALSWLSGVGMLEKYNGKLIDAIPQWMQDQLVNFAKNMQSSEDGYFHHPQWGTNVGTSRRSRDLGWATQIVTTFGHKVLYDTPSGTKGELGKPGQATSFTERLGGSVASAVSKVVATAGAGLPKWLQTPEEFRSYLLGFDWAENSYSAGNTVSSQSGQIEQAGPEFVALFEQILNEKQEIAQEKLRDKAEAEARAKNPSITAAEVEEVRRAAENGLWEDRLSYDAVNGLMKISGGYNSLGLKMPYAEQALQSALTMASFDGVDVEGKRANNVVDVYNPWVSIGNVLTNLKNHYDVKLVAKNRAYVTENAADLIKLTMKKISIFRKADGSYGYNESKVPSKSQGASVALEGVNEGDVNGGSISTNGTFRSMCTALGITVPYRYFNSDFEKFMEIIESLDPVVKLPFIAETDPVTFDDDEVNSEPSRVTYNMNSGYVTVVDDPREGVSGNVLEYVTVKGAGSTITTNIIGTGVGNCYVLEWDMNLVENHQNTVAFQIRLGESFMFTVTTKSDGYTLGDSSSTNSSASVTNNFEGTYSYNTWYTFRIEHYVGTSEEVRTIIYVDGVAVGESDNFYGKTKPDAANKTEPKLDYKVARWYALNSADMTVLFDNLVAEIVSKEYTAPEGTVPEAPAKPVAGQFSFEGTTALPGEIQFNGNGAANSDLSVVSDPTLASGAATNNVLKLSAAAGESGNTVFFNSVNSASDTSNCYVAEMNIYFKSVKDNSVPFQLFLRDGSNANIYALNFDMKESGGKLMLRLYEKTAANSSDTVVDWFTLSDWLTLRIEYYKDAKMAKIYINGVCVADNDGFWSDASANVEYTRLAFFALRATNAEVYIDNVNLERITKEYVKNS